jgi:4-hydroxybenzoate polyprenyltransferase
MSSLGERVKRSAILIALSSASLAIFLSIIMLRTALDGRAALLFLIVMSATLTVYGIDRWLEAWAPGRGRAAGDGPRSDALPRSTLRLWLGALLGLYLLSLALAALASVRIVALVALSPLIVLLYSKDSPVYGERFRVAIKRIPLAKDLYIAAGWTLLGPLALLFYGQGPTAQDVAFLGLMFVKLFVMAVLYDFKDEDADRRDGTWTLQVRLGRSRTMTILQWLNAIATVGFIGLVVGAHYTTDVLVLVPLAIYQALLVPMCREGASDWVYLGLCDLEQVVWLLALLAWRSL